MTHPFEDDYADWSQADEDQKEEDDMNFHMIRIREVEEDLQQQLDRAHRDTANLQQRLDIAHRIMAAQGMVLGQAHAALKLSQEALFWYGAEHFEGADGITVSERVNDTIAEIVS